MQMKNMNMNMKRITEPESRSQIFSSLYLSKNYQGQNMNLKCITEISSSWYGSKPDCPDIADCMIDY